MTFEEWWERFNEGGTRAHHNSECAQAAWDHQQARIAELEELYNELLYSVQSKHPTETRHETALRYIRQAECRPRYAGCDVQSFEIAQATMDRTGFLPGGGE